FFFVPAIITLTFAVAFAQQPSTTAPSVDRLRQVVTYLASDALEGRRTGTPGANDAARYIAGEFNRLGLRAAVQPGPPSRTRVEGGSRYFQSFPYVSKVELGKNNLFFINPGRADDTAQFMIGEDWMPLGFSTNGSIKNAEVVFAGYGISSAELKYNDYAVSNAKDRIAVVFAGSPEGDNPHGQFVQAGQIRFKAAAARAAGARALLIISDEEKFEDDRLSRLSYDNAGEAGIPVLVISKRLAQKILTFGTLEDYHATADVRQVDTHIKRDKPTSSVAEIPRSLALRSSMVRLKLDFTVNVIRRESPSFNVVGILPGSDPILSKLNDETIVIGAHYDHLGRGGEGSLAPREGDIHHGADDNASGVAGLIELARVLSTQNPKPRRTIVFIAFSGEEEGLLGSDYYVNHPIMPLAKTVAMINMDMIGRLQDSKLIVGGVGTASDWRSMIQNENSVEKMQAAAAKNLSASGSPNYQVSVNGQASPGFPIVMGANGQPVVTAELSRLPLSLAAPFTLALNEDGFGPSDHSSFYSKQVPVLFFWTGTHDDYHKPSDTADKINYEGEARILSFVERIVRDIDKSDKRPTYTVAKSEAQGRSSGFRVYLGTIPNYADSNDGLKLDGVRDDSPAAKAGLKAGDRVVKLAGHDVKNVYDYTYALGEMKAGQEYEVEVMRDGQRLTMKIKPEARK
ncbi:MAG TPA: M20/M25/M40 family metallo-hydrolase, partial [Pyrinomonadaceae bacterium]|nr:M20/M25/M40 family metallo-hydrolase [Pyrinomonadaceae bacterium]